MFKISKLYDTNEEKIVITSSKQEVYNVDKGVTDYNLLLEFDINGILDNNKYSFSFDLSCKPDIFFNNDILELEKDKLHLGEVFFNFNDNNGIEPIDLNIKFTKITKNIFIVYISFMTDDYYIGIIEFTFNLDDYLIDLKEEIK